MLPGTSVNYQLCFFPVELMEIDTQAVAPVGLPGSNEICKMAVSMDI